MKKGYKRLLIIELFFLILSSFAHSILSKYVDVLFYIIAIPIFTVFFGTEKDKHRYWKIICVEIIINVVVFLILYYLLGIIIGYVKNLYLHSFISLLKIIIPIIITIILKELLRYNMLMKSEGSKLLFTTTIILFIVMDILSNFNLDIFKSPYALFMFMAIILLPAISKNVFVSYLSYKSGYKPAILYLLIMTLYGYVLPIIPNPNEYMYSIIELVVPMIFLYNIYSFYQKDRDEDIVREYHKKTIASLILPILCIIFLVYIVSGYFKYQAIVIASGSMRPSISKGDVVIIKKNKDYKNIDVGDTLAHKHGNIIVVHRVIKKIKVENHYYFYTKGDNNDTADNYEIEEKEVVGTVSTRIPYIGYPTVWLNNL